MNEQHPRHLHYTTDHTRITRVAQGTFDFTGISAQRIFQVVGQASRAKAVGFGDTPLSGTFHVLWHMNGIYTAPALGSIPRVRVTVNAQDHVAGGAPLVFPQTPPGGLIDPSLAGKPQVYYADAAYGELQVHGSSVQLETGFLGDDTPSGKYELSLVVTYGPGGVPNRTTFTRFAQGQQGQTARLTIPGSLVGPPFTNQGAHRYRRGTWEQTNGAPVDLAQLDFGGNTVALFRVSPTGQNPLVPLSFPIHPLTQEFRVTFTAPSSGFLILET